MKIITSKSFLDVADQVEKMKQSGYSLESPISTDAEGNHTATVVKVDEVTETEAPKKSAGRPKAA